MEENFRSACTKIRRYAREEPDQLVRFALETGKNPFDLLVEAQAPMFDTQMYFERAHEINAGLDREVASVAESLKRVAPQMLYEVPPIPYVQRPPAPAAAPVFEGEPKGSDFVPMQWKRTWAWIIAVVIIFLVFRLVVLVATGQ
jgi:hypothetical protein